MDHLNFQIVANLGDVAEVTLDRAANVLLMDPANYNAYQQHQAYQYYGGHITASPFRMVVPGTGTWNVVVDLGGGPGQVRASARVLPRRRARIGRRRR
jgi:Domain of unknown function (DUF1883)